MGHVVANVDLSAYRVRDDDGTDETDGTFLENINTAHDFDVSAGNVDFRLRLNLAETGGANAPNQTYTARFNINGGGATALGAATTGCQYFDSTKLTDNNDTTEQLDQGGTFVGTGGQCEDGVVNAFILGSGEDLEAEYPIRLIAADLNDGDSITFDILEQDSNSVTPTITITKSSAETVTITLGSWGAVVEQNLNVNESELIAASTSWSWTGQIFANLEKITVTVGSLNTAVLNLKVNESIIPTIGSFAFTANDLLTHEVELIASAILTTAGQNFTESVGARETVLVGNWGLITEQNLNVNAREEIPITPASMNWTGQVAALSVDVTETIGANATWSWQGQNFIEEVTGAEVITPAAFNFYPQAFTDSDGVTTTENLWRDLDEPMRKLMQYGPEEIDRDHKP